MLRILLALAVLGLVIVTATRMMGLQLGGVSRVSGGDLAASAGAPVTPKAAAEQAAQGVQKALQSGAAISAERASEAGR